MKFGEIYINAPEELKDLPVESIQCDSRRVTKNSVFVCINGTVLDGHKYAQAFAKITQYLKNPHLLEEPPKDEDVHVDYPFEGLSERFKSEKTKAKEAKKAEKARKKAAKQA